MGYAHYIYTSFKPKDKKSFSLVVEQSKKIINLAKKQGIEIADGSGLNLNKEELTPNLINFNGYKEDSCENFLLEFNYLVNKVEEFSFCKTARNPYDVVVIATLVATEQVFGFGNNDVKITTDGKYEDWVDGINLYAESLDMMYELKVLLHKQYQQKFNNYSQLL